MSQTAKYQYENYRYCIDNGHLDWLLKAETCFNFWRSRQWDEAIKAQRIREGRPAFTFNIIESLIRAMKGIQRALRNDVRFAPVSNASNESALTQDALWMHIQNQNNLDFLEADIYERGLIMSRAYYEVRVSTDKSTQGDVVIKPRRSRDIILDPTVDEYDPDDWPQVIDRRWVSYADMVQMHGREKANAARAMGSPNYFQYEDALFAEDLMRQPYFAHGQMEESQYARAMLLLSRQYNVYKNKDVFINLQTGETKEIPETWDRNRVSFVLERANQMIPNSVGTINRKVKTIRWCVTCNDEVMHDSDSPYSHFTIVPYFPTFVEGETMGAVETLVDPQQLYNLMTNSEIHIVASTANGGYKVRKGNLKNMTPQELERNGARTGLVIEVDDVAQLEKFQPNQLPAGHDRLSSKSEQLMRNIAGVSNSGRGFSRDDASGDKVTQDQAAQDINSASWLSNLHRSKHLLARRVLDCVQSHYDGHREFMITSGSIFAPKAKKVEINDGSFVNDVTSGEYTTVLVPSPSRTSLSIEDFELVLKLRTEAGIQFPDELLVELSPASNKAALIQALDGQSGDRAKAAQEAAAAQAEVELGLGRAKIEKEKSASSLNSARAAKFAVETESDPDAAYERVEQERIQADRDESQERLAIDRERIAMEERNSRRQTALELTKIHSQETIAAKNNEAKVKTAAMKPKPKPPTKSGGKAKTPARKR